MPEMTCPKKLRPILTTKKRFVVLVGGRGSAKSETLARLMIMRCQTENADVLCGREYQNSIETSVHKLLKTLIEGEESPNLNLSSDFYITDKKIDCKRGGGFRFRGFSGDTQAVKSAAGFRYCWIEEAQSLSAQSLQDLTPTIRAEGSQLFFSANLSSSTDPFSKRFINPYMRYLLTDGYYEDDMHLIIVVNWRDNPWLPPGLQQERLWDLENKPRALYDHIWEFAFNDSVEDALIQAEWFDACKDAHKVLGFKPQGAIMAAHDPADEGGDSKGFAMRHGSVVTMVDEKHTGNVNDGCDWALDKALNARVDAFTWDCDGMGISLGRQVSKAFDGKHTRVAMFRGSEGVDFPDDLFEPLTGAEVQDQKKNKDALKNKRAQYYLELRRRCINTYNAVAKGEYCDPDKMISFDTSLISEGMMQKLRSELCRMPIKPNGSGLFELYTKKEMKSRWGIESPNLADSVMMLMRQPHSYVETSHHRPRAYKAIGGKR